MSTRASDFDLIVGADIQASADQLVKDIEAAIKLVNGTPRKIKLELDDSLIKTQLISIKDQIAALNGQKIEIKAGSEFGNIIKASGTLSESIKKASTNIKTLSDDFRKLASNSGAGNIVNDLQQVTPVIEGLKSEITSLQALMKDFNGININLNPGGGNSVLRTAQYGTSARQTIAELQTQAREIEKIFESLHTDKITGKPIYNGVEALFKVVQGTDVFKGRDVFSIIENVNNPKGSLSSRMDALREYIHLYEKAASVRGIDISAVTSSFAHGADELVEKTRKIQSGEADLEAATERLKKVFGSGLDAEALATQLTQINESINGVVKAIESINTSGQSVESIAASVTTISQSLTDLLSKLEAVNQTKIGVDATPIKQQISETVSQVAAATAEEAKFKAILDSASAGAVKTGEAVRGAAQTVKESFDTINFDTPISKAAELKSVLVGKGVEENFADKIAKDMVEATGEVSKLSLTVDKLGDGTVKSAKVVVDSFDKMNTALQTTINYKSTIDNDGNQFWNITTTDRVTKSIDDIETYRKLLEDVKKTKTNVSAFLNKNAEAKNISEPYNKLLELLPKLDAQLKACGGDAGKLKAMLSSSGSEGIKGVNNLINEINGVVNTMKGSLTEKGLMGTPLDTLTNRVSAARNLLNSNSALNESGSYKALSDYIDKLSPKLQDCAKGSQTLEVALSSMGKNGATALSELDRLMSEFKATASQSGVAAKEEAAILKNRESIQNAANSAILSGEKALRNWSAAEHSHNTESREAYAALKREVDQLKAAASGANKDAESLRNLKSATSSVNSTLKETEATLVRNGNATEKFSAKIGNLVQKFSSWFTITQVIMYTIRSIKKMVSASVELNSALTQMQIVTKASDSEMRAFSDSAAKAAKRVGSDITDFVSSATTYARLGQTMEESEWMAEYTAKLQALGEIDVSDAQDAVTSIIKAFDIDPMQIDKVMDKLIVVSNNFPINAEQISEGMTNASSALAAAGNSFEQSVALLTAANTTIQNAAKSSTGLRTIAARIRNTKTELDELGESMTKAEYDKLVQSLSNHNVKLTDANNEFRSTYDIVADIAKEWDNMSSMEQAALAETLSGKHTCQYVQKCA